MTPCSALNIPEEDTLQNHHCENLKSYTVTKEYGRKWSWPISRQYSITGPPLPIRKQDSTTNLHCYSEYNIVKCVVLGFAPMKMFLFFSDFYVFGNGASSSTRGGVWLLLVTPPLLGSDCWLPLTHSLTLRAMTVCNVSVNFFAHISYSGPNRKYTNTL
jgi:hypothetical protein